MTLASVFSPDLVVVAALAVVLLFGASRLPKLARCISEAAKEFRRADSEPSQPPDSAVPSDRD